jgi:mono/diheme cytochrome c family protein
LGAREVTRLRVSTWAAIASLGLFALALGCSDETASSSAEAQQPATPAEQKLESLVARGRAVYVGNCIACHNPDPTQDGGLGPSVAGASRELLEARVLRADYPPGYTPKRDSHLMIALPHLAGDIDALHAYLAAASDGADGGS